MLADALVDGRRASRTPSFVDDDGRSGSRREGIVVRDVRFADVRLTGSTLKARSSATSLRALRPVGRRPVGATLERVVFDGCRMSGARRARPHRRRRADQPTASSTALWLRMASLAALRRSPTPTSRAADLYGATLPRRAAPALPARRRRAVHRHLRAGRRCRARPSTGSGARARCGASPSTARRSCRWRCTCSRPSGSRWTTP